MSGLEGGREWEGEVLRRLRYLRIMTRFPSRPPPCPHSRPLSRPPSFFQYLLGLLAHFPSSLSLQALDTFLHLSDSIAEIKSMPSTSLSATIPPPPFLPPPFPPSNHHRCRSPCSLHSLMSIPPSFLPFSPSLVHVLFLSFDYRREPIPSGSGTEAGGREGGDRKQPPPLLHPWRRYAPAVLCVEGGREGGKEGGREGGKVGG